MAFFTAQQCLNQMLGTTALDATQALNQILGQAPPTWGGTSTGSADAQAIAPSRAITAYAAGQIFAFKAGYTNTGAATLAVSGLTAKAIQANGAALGAGDLTAGQTYIVTYDGTVFQLFGQAVAMGDIPSGIDAAKIADGSVSNAEFQCLDATSSIQTQINGKAATSHTHNASAITAGVFDFAYIPGWGGTSGGSADAQTLTPATAIASYVAGQYFRFIAGYTNTGAATLNVSGLGVKTIRKDNAALSAGDITAGRTYMVVYDGTYFQLLGSGGGASSLALSALTAGALGVSLQLGSASDSPAGSVAYLRYNGTSAITNVPTGKSLVDSVNGTAVRTTSGAIDSLAIPIKWSTNVALTSSDYSIGLHSSSRLAVNFAQFGSFAVLNQGTACAVFDGTNLDLTGGNDTILFASHGGGGAGRAIKGSFYGVEINPGAGQVFYVSPSNTQAVGLDANGMTLLTGAGSVTNGTRGVYQTSAGVIVNTPSSTTVSLAVNGSNLVAANSTGVGLYGVTPVARATTGVAAAAFTANSGTAVNDASTFGGYTLKQIAQALQNIGILT